MKIGSKFLCVFIAFVFILCSCQGTEPEIIPEYNNEVGSVDLDGFEVYWGFAKSGSGEDNVFGYIPGTALADLAMERMKNIQNAMDCVINMEYGTFGTVNSNMVAYVMSGSPHYDIVTNESYSHVDSVRAGYLTGLSSYIDVSDVNKWGTPNVLQSLTWQDDLYGVVPFAWPELLYSTTGHVLAVNETIVSKLGQPDPREFVENLTWTWDKFEEVLAAYTHQDSGRTVYSLQCHAAYFAMNMFLSNGNALSAYENGKVVCGAYTESGRVALERANQIYNHTCVDYIYPDSSTESSYFFNGDVVMQASWHGGLFGNESSILYQMENIGVLPFPQGPNAIPGKYPSYHESILYATVIPVNAKDPAAAVLVLEEMYEPFEGFETQEDIISYMSEQIFFDERDARVFVNMLENTEYGFFKEGARGVIESAVEVSTSIVSLLESNEDKYDKIVEDYMRHHYDGRIAVYGE